MWSENISRRATNSYKELSWVPTTVLPNQSFQGEPGKHPSEIACLGYSLNTLKFGSHHPKTFPGGSDGKESVCNTGDPGLIPGSRRTLGEGNSNPLQYSCLETPMDRGAWQATHLWSHKESGMTGVTNTPHFTLKSQHSTSHPKISRSSTADLPFPKFTCSRKMNRP